MCKNITTSAWCLTWLEEELNSVYMYKYIDEHCFNILVSAPVFIDHAITDNETRLDRGAIYRILNYLCNL